MTNVKPGAVAGGRTPLRALYYDRSSALTSVAFFS